jgi:hypothetical protein
VPAHVISLFHCANSLSYLTPTSAPCSLTPFAAVPAPWHIPVQPSQFSHFATWRREHIIITCGTAKPGHSTRPVARPSFPSSFNYSRTLASCAPRPTPPLIKAWKWGIVMYGMQRAPKAQLASAYARASHGETDRVPGRSQTCCAAERLEVGAKVEAGSLPAGTVRRERGKGDRQAGCVRTRSAWSKKSDVVIS